MNNNQPYQLDHHLFSCLLSRLAYQWYKLLCLVVCFGCLCRLSSSCNFIWFFRWSFSVYVLFSTFYGLLFLWISNLLLRRSICVMNLLKFDRFCNCIAMLSHVCTQLHPNCDLVGCKLEWVRLLRCLQLLTQEIF